MKVLITGASGFVGSYLVEALVPRYEVNCVVRKTSNLKWLQDPSIRLVYGDLLDKDSLREEVKDVDYMYHLAATTRGVRC